MSLNADAIRQHLGDALARLERLDVFAEIESTNSYLMQRPGPTQGHVCVAATDNQTAGHGRHGRSWQSPPGTGLCLSMAYTFTSEPDNLPALTLAVGLGVVHALQEQGIGGLQLKWPNDLIARDRKLGGILTEAQSQAGGPVTIVTGIGLNLDRSHHPELLVESDRAQRIIDLKTHADFVPDRNKLASGLINGLTRLLVGYEADGFDRFREQWQQHDWLRGRAVTVETPRRQVAGIGVGVDDDGALLIDTQTGGLQRITFGTVVAADVVEFAS